MCSLLLLLVAPAAALRGAPLRATTRLDYDHLYHIGSPVDVFKHCVSRPAAALHGEGVAADLRRDARRPRGFIRSTPRKLRRSRSCGRVSQAAGA